MTPKRQRMWFAIFAVGFLVAAVLLIMNAFRDNLVFFFTPTDVASKKPAATEYFRLGGMVEKGSVQQEGETLRFTVTDYTESLDVSYNGLPPTLFREGQGVVAEGHLKDGRFIATKLLAKHDENYMPPEVAKAIKDKNP
ncbi:MAG: cytochrome c maturation protein CcmE [Alphaproteobacteria bacterium]|nr:cytochrome c maturation protein CcmE [Alphaproteobacteria bacterium]